MNYSVDKGHFTIEFDGSVPQLKIIHNPSDQSVVAIGNVNYNSVITLKRVYKLFEKSAVSGK